MELATACVRWMIWPKREICRGRGFRRAGVVGGVCVLPEDPEVEILGKRVLMCAGQQIAARAA